MAFINAVFNRADRLGLPIPRGVHKFLGVGLVGLIVHTGVFSLLYKLNAEPLVDGVGRLIGRGWLFQMIRTMNAEHSFAWLIGLVTATSITWTLNRKFTFKSTGRKLHHEAFRYAIVTIVSQTVAFLVFHGLVELAKWIPAPVDVVLGAGVATIFSYAGQRFFTFAPSAGKADAA